MLLVASGSPARAEDGVTDTEIRIGMANALTGPASGLGTDLKTGATAFLTRINAAGGVNGRKVVLVSKDDGYEPKNTASATQALIEKDKVFALFGYVGTPTSAAAVPLASRSSVPYLFPFTGAEFLRNPVNKFVFNVRASYFDETELMIERLTKDIGAKKIMLFIQDDAFGEAGKAGVNRALHKRGMAAAEEARYKRNTLGVDEGVAKIKAAAPDAVIFVGTYASLSAAVKKAKAQGIKAPFMTVSFIGTERFIQEAGADGDGVYITQVMPALDSGVPVVAQYLGDMKGGPINYSSLEGYVDAAVLVEALKKAGANPTRAGLVGALEGLSADIGGLKIAFSAANHQGMKNVFLTVVRGGKAVQVDKL
ncbi:MAG: ABC transporter substrate-binding protein [Xanthomonadaceae bacterium]|nr:ABC transporter substrate-binding protein [Xanthomonadaceae bacterium]